MRWSVNRMVLAGCAVVLAAGPVRAVGPALPAVQSRDFASTAATLAVGSRLRLENVQIANTGESQALVLERFDVFTEDAKITVHGDGGEKVLPPPANVYFRGVVDGKPESRAFLARLEDGRTQGVISDGDDVYLIGADPAAKALGGPLEMHRVDPVLLKAARGEAFTCGSSQIPGLSGKGTVALDLGDSPAAPQEKETAAGAPAHTARVAIETDFEYYSLFNNVTNATNYAGNLIGYASTIYTAELNTALVVSSVELWQNSGDPWTQTGSTLCGLLEFGKYWNQNKTGVSRTIAHFLSGKSLGGGIAWLNALCHAPFFTGGASSCPTLGTESTAWGGDYGFTANISGGFDINNPTVVWDIYSTSHEIGHNFGSPHSHCYNGLEGNASPIDQCYGGEQGCYSGATSLPGSGRSGTIMSYCHLIGGYGAIALTFGTNFSFGVQPGREALHMNNYISSVASSNPACIAPVSVTGIFSDGFEGGAVPGLWTGKTP